MLHYTTFHVLVGRSSFVESWVLMIRRLSSAAFILITCRTRWSLSAVRRMSSFSVDFRFSRQCRWLMERRQQPMSVKTSLVSCLWRVLKSWRNFSSKFLLHDLRQHTLFHPLSTHTHKRIHTHTRSLWTVKETWFWQLLSNSCCYGGRVHLGS